MPYKPCSINEMGLKLHIVNEKLEEIHHGIVSLPKAFLQMNTIFISILIEALPFVLIGVFISGFIQMFVTEDMVANGCRRTDFCLFY